MQPNTTPLRRAEWWALLGILLLAAGLRFGYPGIFEFKRDEANLSHLARDMAQGKVFPLLGIDSSVGIPNAPVSVYLLAIPYLFTSDPMIATMYVALLNVIAVGLVYLLARRYYGQIAAVMAGIFYAISPWAVIYSRKIWAQDMLPVFVLLTIGTALLGFIEGKKWAQLLHLPLLAITGQIHYGAFVLIPISVYLILVGRKHWTRQFALSFVIAAIVVLPYAIGAVKAGLLNPGVLKKIGASASASTGNTAVTPPTTGEAWQDAAIVITGIDIHSLAGDQAYQAYLDTVPDAYPLFELFGILIALATIWLIIRAIRRRSPLDVTLLLWLLFTPIAYSFNWTPIYPHYFIAMIPAAYLIFGVGVADFWSLVPKSAPVITSSPEPEDARSDNLKVKAPPVNTWEMLRARLVIFGGGILGLIGALQVWLLIALYSFLAANPTQGGFGVPLGYLMPIRNAILAKHPDHVLASLDGMFIGYNEDTTIWNFLLYDVPDLRFLDKNMDVYPATSTVYLSRTCTTHTENYPLRPTEGCYAISIRNPSDFDARLDQPVQDNGAKFANGIQIIDYRWTTSPAPCLTLITTPDGPHPEDFQFAIHLIDADKHKVADADAIGWRGRYWQVGDRISNQFCMSQTDHAAQVAGVQVGMYTYYDDTDGRHFNNIDVLDAHGVAIGQQIEIMFTPSQ